MRVLVVTTVHTPTDARILHRQIRALLEAGWQVTYAAGFRGDEPVDARVTRVPLRRSVGRRRLGPARDAWRVLAGSARHHDVVLLHDPELLPVAMLAPRVAPVVWDVHEDTAAALSDRSWVPQLMRPLLRGAIHVAERAAERRFSLLLAEERYADRFRSSHPIVPNLPWRRRPPPGQSPEPYVVHVGRLSRSRGLEEMIALGHRLGGDVEVRLIGRPDADVRPLLRDAIARGAVTWLGELPNDQALHEVEGALAGLSLLRDHPNFRHSLPTKVVEYLACGVPAVSTPLPEAVRILEAHGGGVVVPYGDVDAAARTVARLRDDGGLRTRLASEAIAATQGELCWDAHVGDLLAALRAAASDRQTGRRRRRRERGVRPTR